MNAATAPASNALDSGGGRFLAGFPKPRHPWRPLPESFRAVLTEEQFYDLMDRIERLGYDEETAARFAGLIGDKPCQDAESRTVVVDKDGGELARLPLFSCG